MSPLVAGDWGTAVLVEVDVLGAVGMNRGDAGCHGSSSLFDLSHTQSSDHTVS
eukprot:SAG31_NODE_35556_length_322_cov_0.578475_1_plen_52_part_01